jgi:hypothetical protein
MRRTANFAVSLAALALIAACGKDKPAEAPAVAPAPAVEPAAPAAVAPAPVEASPVVAPAAASPAAAVDGAKADNPACAHGGDNPACEVKIDPSVAAAHGPEVKLEGEKYGGGVTLAEATQASKIMANPDEFVGKRVRVEGEVLEVCKMAGCWFNMKTDDGKTMKFKVKDGDMVFRQDGVGKHAVTEGIVRKMVLDMDQTIKVAEHEALEQGKPFDRASIKEPMTIVRIEGLGAVLQPKK